MLTWLRRLRLLFWCVIALAVTGSVAALIYLQRVGLPQASLRSIEQLLAKHDVHAAISGAKYNLRDGLVAEKIELFAHAKRSEKIASIGKAEIGIDKTKALRGRLKIDSLKFYQGAFTIPTDPNDARRGVLQATDCSAELSVSNNERFQIESLKGFVNGVELDLVTQITPTKITSPPLALTEESSAQSKSHTLAFAGVERIVIKRIIDALASYQYEDDNRPYLSLTMRGDLDHPALIESTLEFSATVLKSGDYEVRDFDMSFAIQGSFINIKQITFSDELGETNASGYFDVKKGKGKATVSSQSAFQQACLAFFGKNPLPNISVKGAQKLETEIDLTYNNRRELVIGATGKIEADEFDLGKLELERTSTDFSWKKDYFFARNLQSSLLGRKLGGQFFIQQNDVKLDLTTNFPLDTLVSLGRPKMLLKVVAQGKLTEPSKGMHRLQAEVPVSTLY